MWERGPPCLSWKQAGEKEEKERKVYYERSRERERAHALRVEPGGTRCSSPPSRRRFRALFARSAFSVCSHAYDMLLSTLKSTFGGRKPGPRVPTASAKGR
jgi:hypothetical protein